ncbi:MAG: TIR domain-containing protein [Candidatus Yonathbacteria bacterium]|nr:TIR domain-containing protein [Candidatus Yonathbacteria bacterium]
MARKCYISFKTEDMAYKEAIQNDSRIDMIDKSLNEPIDSDDEDYIMQVIRSEYLSDSTVTIHLIGTRSAERLGYEEQKFIKRELQASLYDGENNPRSGILGVVLPDMYATVYQGANLCGPCGNNISCLNVGDETMISEFHQNYHIPHGKCHWNEDDRYCILIKWEDFWRDPNTYIEQAFLKRTHPVVQKVTVRP